MRYIKFLLPALFAGFIAACGGSGGGTTTPASVDVTLSAQVYDQAIANATVEVFVGANATPVATTTTDAEGNWSVDLTVTEEARANNCVVVARRDNISLRSLLGNVGAIADTATANNGTVTPTELPSANVTNVSTAIAAIIEQAGALPSTQADIDAAVDGLIGSDAVTQIAAAIKAVVDYGGSNLLGGTDTAALAEALAGSADLAGDLAAVIADSDADSLAALVLEVEGDPLLASQLPSNEADLVTGLVGNSYVTSNSLGEETFLRFDTATDVIIGAYDDIEAGGIAGTYVNNQDGTFTVQFIEAGETATTTAVLTVTGGSANAISTNVVVNGVNEGLHVLRRMIPIGATGGPTLANMVDIMFVDVDASTSFELDIATCNGTDLNVTLRSYNAIIGASCSLAEGMLVVNSILGKSMHALLADSWNGTNISQQVSIADWRADTTIGSIATYRRLYTPINAGTPTVGQVLRVYPSDDTGSVRAQVRFLNTIDTAGDASAQGSFDSYNQGGAGTKDSIVGVTTAEVPALQDYIPAGLTVNGSVNPGQAFVTHGSTSIGINLGNNANSRISAILRQDGTIRTRYQYSLSPLTSADVSGKSFDFQDLVFGDPGVATFNADGTGTFVDTTSTEDFSWEIATAPVASDLTGSAAANHGTTLKITLADGTIDYFYGKKLGSAMIVGAYNLNADGSYNENVGATLVERDASSAPAPTPVATLACSTESGWNDAADGGLGAPINPHSFADFEAVIAGCGTATTFTAADIAGNTYNENPELTTFNALGGQLGTQASPGTGTYNDTAGFVLNFEWYVETVNGVSYVVVYTDETIDSNITTLVGAGFKLRETSAVTGVSGSTYTFKNYSEQSNYSTDGLVRGTGTDGEIWTATRTLQ